MLKPGPKSKGACPADIHLRLPDLARDFLNSLGPGGNQDKIVSIILQAAQKQSNKTQMEVQAEITKITREIKKLEDQRQELKDELSISFGLTTKQYEDIMHEIYEAIYPEDKAVSLEQ
jgi:hypothetical protein